MSDSKEQILEILQKAFQIEVDGHTFYSMARDQARNPAVEELFDKLASDEVEHKRYLAQVATDYDAKGVAAFRIDRRSPDLKALSASIFTDQFKQQAKGAAFEMGVLSIGMTLENNAISYFNRAAKLASDQEVKDFYEFLANWEKEHLEALQGLYNGVRQDFWQESGFSPF